MPIINGSDDDSAENVQIFEKMVFWVFPRYIPLIYKQSTKTIKLCKEPAVSNVRNCRYVRILVSGEIRIFGNVKNLTYLLNIDNNSFDQFSFTEFWDFLL